MDKDVEEMILNYFEKLLENKSIEEIREKMNTYKNKEVTVA